MTYQRILAAGGVLMACMAVTAEAQQQDGQLTIYLATTYGLEADNHCQLMDYAQREAVAHMNAAMKGSLVQRYNREALEAGLFSANRLVGMIGFNTIDWTARRSEIGYWIDAEHQKKGLITQGCRTLIDHGFNELDLNRIEIRCATGNNRSRAIPERMGFTCEGIMRQTEWLYDHFEDHCLYALLRSEWSMES